ncbi:class A sortase [Lacticaseibacillus saniviri]|uniref:Sortase n=1 Tax=Lacticaseibacillus saniviri JCM 17471 = DSM 24301 TaxID=1293598 RepID=A0A0R2MTP8_9LACO|nr:class A sortase [Lacticaseibacillus saniviri]KRO16884.1 hypothetical protein IV56_GL000570 [Lacticaseibacillus saniviri JCM 17471 = DSM 24301]MCG4281066.1 class A sortase [Lacticaseibacillus saniviri]
MRKIFRLRNILALVILLLGVALIFSDQIERYAIERYTAYYLNNTTAETIKANQKKKGNFNFAKVKPIGMTNVVQAAVDKPNVLGKMAIPDAGMYLPILNGLSDNNLATGAGTMKQDEEMGKGNYALAGHYMTENGPLFSNLDKVAIGQGVYITDMTNIYVYRVTSVQTVYRNQTQWVDDVKGHKTITLITCASSQLDEANRLVVRGEFVQKIPATKERLKVFRI